jgi:hypothetical protein
MTHHLTAKCQRPGCTLKGAFGSGYMFCGAHYMGLGETLQARFHKAARQRYSHGDSAPEWVQVLKDIDEHYRQSDVFLKQFRGS